MDDKANRGAADRSRINLDQDYEVRYWTEALGVSEAELRRVVKEVGNSADKVRAQLKQRTSKQT
jgi:uncharacterized protein DUF3606